MSLIASLFYSDPIIDKQLNHILYVLYLVGDLVCHYLPANSSHHDIVVKQLSHTCYVMYLVGDMLLPPPVYHLVIA